ncbi:Protein kinase domain,Protein kinase-like domain,Serine/threonine-protein kinase, active [Cinara cedri]|uniref:Protein kinase domain,Protein kinase-like domain,Serine/threonine-protein kinase, active n=1 Tax=Cinara cedri TaxID=506608 RepID=A0A5E4M561_9HEMI|nr:Protein kinase domain,Protein kinase-like domain,Serine/threonine-protein kinase, active [Cinara cedri]
MNSHHQYHSKCRSPRSDQGREQPPEKDRQRLQQQRQPVNWRSLHVSPPPASQPPPECQQQHNKAKIVELSDDALPGTLVTDGYQLGSTVGYGSYSKVRMALKSLPGNKTTRLACKVIDKKRVTGGSYVRKFLPRELDVLCAVRHPHVVRTHRIYATPSIVHVFMDYCESGDLLSHLQNAKTMPQWQAHTFFKQICDAVEYLHQKDISHRDIKCENVLLESMRHVKLADFGFARMCSDERGRRLMSQTYCGSSSYAAPEVLQGIPYDPKAYDVWALGVVLYVMLADTMPYPHSNRQQIVANQVAKKFAKPKKPVSRDALRLIS